MLKAGLKEQSGYNTEVVQVFTLELECDEDSDCWRRSRLIRGKCVKQCSRFTTPVARRVDCF